MRRLPLFQPYRAKHPTPIPADLHRPSPPGHRHCRHQSRALRLQPRGVHELLVARVARLLAVAQGSRCPPSILVAPSVRARCVYLQRSPRARRVMGPYRGRGLGTPHARRPGFEDARRGACSRSGAHLRLPRRRTLPGIVLPLDRRCRGAAVDPRRFKGQGLEDRPSTSSAMRVSCRLRAFERVRLHPFGGSLGLFGIAPHDGLLPTYTVSPCQSIRPPDRPTRRSPFVQSRYRVPGLQHEKRTGHPRWPHLAE